jgi:hypothetical protein
MSAIISHTEMLDPFSCPGGVWAYDINPGLDSTFTWLHFQSKMWEAYRYLKLQFRYVPSCSMTSSGTISMAFDYDCLDTAPTDITVMSNYATFKTTSIRAPMTLILSPAEMVRLFKSHAVRHASIGTNDRKTYDVGTLYILTEGDELTQCGTMYVDYTVEFYQPTVPSDGLSNFAFSSVELAKTVDLVSDVANYFLPFTVDEEYQWSIPGLLRRAVDVTMQNMRSYNGAYTSVISGAIYLFSWLFLKPFTGQLQLGHNSGYAVFAEDWADKSKSAKGKEHVGGDVLVDYKFFPSLHRLNYDTAGTSTIVVHGIAPDNPNRWLTPIHDTYPEIYTFVGVGSGPEDTHIEYYDVSATAGDYLVIGCQLQHGPATVVAACTAYCQPWITLLDEPAQIQSKHIPLRKKKQAVVVCDQ